MAKAKAPYRTFNNIEGFGLIVSWYGLGDQGPLNKIAFRPAAGDPMTAFRKGL